MRWSNWFMTLLVSLVLISNSFTEDKPKPKSKLEGTWISEMGGRSFKLTFKKGKFSVVLPNGKKGNGTYKIDTKMKPHHLDMSFTEGDPNVVGKKALCIYEVKENTMKWSANDPAKGNPRPKSFPNVPGGGKGYIYLTFKRVIQKE